MEAEVLETKPMVWPMPAVLSNESCRHIPGEEVRLEQDK